MYYTKINPILIRMKESAKGSVYQSIVALGYRSRQINDYIRFEIQEKLADVIDGSDTETTNYDQIAISREFDKLTKPTFTAMNEIYTDKLHFTLPEVEEPKEEIV